MHPYRQGALDGLCGVYAVVNAPGSQPRPIGGSTGPAAKGCFGLLIDELGQLRKAMTVGIGAQPMRLLRRAGSWLEDEHGLLLRVEKPFRKVDEPQHCRKVVTTHLAQPGIAAIIGMAEHWSVARAIGRKQLHLFDSDGQEHLRVAAVFGTSRKQERRRLVLPRTFLLRVTLPTA
jgi:hypothetical protein